MTKTQEILNDVFKLISVIPVSGDNVEIMAKARELLRIAYAEGKDNGEEGEDDGR